MNSKLFTNQLGQTIQPGTEVTYVATCTGRKSINTGVYEGVTDSGMVVISGVKDYRYKFSRESGWVREECIRKAILRRNNIYLKDTPAYQISL